MQAIISDASCLILLHKIGELHLLQKLYGSIMTTPVVANEFGKPLPEWIHLQNPVNNNYELLLKVALDQGEASAIALALEHKQCLLIIDEQKGRKIALQLGLTITGTLGVLVQAKQNGFVEKLSPLLAKVKQTDFRLSEQLIEEALKQAGE